MRWWREEGGKEVSLGSDSHEPTKIAAGFAAPPDVAGAVRPTVTYPGAPFFDTSLNGGTGKPIWRDAANASWRDATGAAV